METQIHSLALIECKRAVELLASYASTSIRMFANRKTVHKMIYKSSSAYTSQTQITNH